MTGIQFITDEKGRKTAAIIDLKRHKALGGYRRRAGFTIAGGAKNASRSKR